MRKRIPIFLDTTAKKLIESFVERQILAFRTNESVYLFYNLKYSKLN